MDKVAKETLALKLLNRGVDNQVGRRLARNRDAFFTAWLISISEMGQRLSSQAFWKVMDGLENGDIKWEDGELLAKQTAARKTAFSEIYVDYEKHGLIAITFNITPRLKTLAEVRQFMLDNGLALWQSNKFDETSKERNQALYDQFVKKVNIAFTDPTPASMGGRGKKKKSSKRSGSRSGSRKRPMKRSGSLRK